MRQTRTRVWTITCPQCHVEMFSRAHHDFRMCGCPFGMMVDGGFLYVRYGGKELGPLRDSFRYRFIKASKQELYDDWNQRHDKFGVVAKKRRANMKPRFHTLRVVANWEYDDGERWRDGYLIVDDAYDGDKNRQYYAQVFSHGIAVQVAKTIAKMEGFKYKGAN